MHAGRRSHWETAGRELRSAENMRCSQVDSVETFFETGGLAYRVLLQRSTHAPACVCASDVGVA